MANIFKTLSDRFKNRKRSNKEASSEAQKIFKDTFAGGKRSYNPKNEGRAGNSFYKDVLARVKENRKKNPGYVKKLRESKK